jgi:hypothetical protein
VRQQVTDRRYGFSLVLMMTGDSKQIVIRNN